MKMKNVQIGQECTITKNMLTGYPIGLRVKVEEILDSIVSHKPTFVLIRVIDKESEYYNLPQTVYPDEIEVIE